MKGASRDLTKKFNNMRDSYRHPKEISIDIEEPQTLSFVHKAKEYLDEIDKYQLVVEDNYRNRVKVEFDTKKEELSKRNLSSSVTRMKDLLMGTYKIIKSIDPHTMEYQYLMNRYTKASTLFRNTHQTYIGVLSSQEESVSSFDQSQDQLLPESHIQREREISNLVGSVSELASIFNQLNELVVHQGTVLDRIDYNVDRSLNHVKEGKEELVKADEYSRSNTKCSCITILILLLLDIILLSIVLSKKK